MQISNQKGAALMGVLVAVVILGLMSGIAGSTWSSTMQRAKEQELLWRGNQYRQAIGSYYETAHGGAAGIFPSDLESLTKDPRSAVVVRHLRKLFLDPMTGEDWVVIKDPSGKISGVHSSSTQEPFKKSGFSEINKDFEDKESYSEWQFVFTPAAKAKKKTETAETQNDPETGTVEENKLQ